MGIAMLISLVVLSLLMPLSFVRAVYRCYIWDCEATHESMYAAGFAIAMGVLNLIALWAVAYAVYHAKGEV